MHASPRVAFALILPYRCPCHASFFADAYGGGDGSRPASVVHVGIAQGLQESLRATTPATAAAVSDYCGGAVFRKLNARFSQLGSKLLCRRLPFMLPHAIMVEGHVVAARQAGGRAALACCHLIGVANIQNKRLLQGGEHCSACRLWLY